MVASEARIQANRLNARKSTGPKTEEGKAASRANALKHGMTGSGVVASESDSAVVAELSATLRDEMRPVSALGSILVERMAVLAVRMDRCGRQESAATAERARNATLDFDDLRADEADACFASLVEAEPRLEPGPLLRKLRRTPEGITRLIQGWVDLASAVRRPDLSPWGEAHLRTFEALSGRRPADLSPSRAAILSRVMAAGDLSGLAAAESRPLAGLAPQARADWARDRLLDLITVEVDELEATYKDLDHASIELDRAGASTRTLFDTSKAATLARKYEAAAERGFFRALREFHQAEDARALAEAPDPTPPSPEARRGSLASFFPGASAPVGRDAPAFGAHRPANSGRPEGAPEAVGSGRSDAGSGGIR